MDQQHLKTEPEAPVTYDISAVPIKELPESLRPREEFEARGAGAVSDDTLLAIILRSGTPQKNVHTLAREILIKCGGLEQLSKMSLEELRCLEIKGFGKVKTLELASALEIGRRTSMMVSSVKEEPTSIRQPNSVYRFMAPLAHNLSQEVFWVIMLNIKNRVIGKPVEVTRGLLNSSPVHPREMFRDAVRHSAAAVILVHNHPSGDPTPSNEDVAITRRLIEAARIMGISILDHIIIGSPSLDRDAYLSMRERKLVNFETIIE
ncbi:MAG: DNA repair protein RadC [Lentisphaerae bacterium]|jgi:DNA repair protein RadC|nr:DNA repair protein RadC [Lentisphaerota bacterium]